MLHSVGIDVGDNDDNAQCTSMMLIAMLFTVILTNEDVLWKMLMLWMLNIMMFLLNLLLNHPTIQSLYAHWKAELQNAIAQHADCLTQEEKLQTCAYTEKCMLHQIEPN